MTVFRSVDQPAKPQAPQLCILGSYLLEQHVFAMRMERAANLDTINGKQWACVVASFDQLRIAHVVDCCRCRRALGGL